MWSTNKMKNLKKNMITKYEQPENKSLLRKNKKSIFISEKNYNSRNSSIENNHLHSNKINIPKKIDIQPASEDNDKMQRVKVYLGDPSSLQPKYISNNNELTMGLVKDNRDKLLEKLKRYRPRMNQKKRKGILQMDPWIYKLFHCRSKSNLITLFLKLPKQYKDFIKIYLEKCFLLHLHLRQIKNLFQLMEHRQSIYTAIDDPHILNGNMKFKNNMVKNFSKGVVNFIVLFYEDLKGIKLLPSVKLLKISSE
jgi:hypothetical protein